MLAENDSRGVQYSVAIVTEEESSFPEMRRVLAPTFQTVLASTEKQIRALMDTEPLHAILLDLGSIENGAGSVDELSLSRRQVSQV